MSLLTTTYDGTVIPLGCNNPAGALGHVSAALELADQIELSEADGIDAIYVAVGSSCTISGLIVGVALSIRLGQTAFLSQRFSINGIIVHHLLAAAQRRLGLHERFPFMPLTISHTVREACAAMHALGGPDVTDDALRILRDAVRLHTDPAVVGKYGAHSDKSRVAAKLFDTTGRVEDRMGEPSPPLWLCGHFVAKAYAVMAADLSADSSMRAILWQTKSVTQPRGPRDEWARLQAMDPATHKWANEGAAESTLRPGSVNVPHGCPEDYRGLMTEIKVGDGEPVEL